MSQSSDVRGSSRSINKTIKEIEDFLQADGSRPSGSQLRDFLHERLADFGEKWLKHGFKGGCIRARREFDKQGKFPTKVSYTGDRELFTDRTRKVKLVWKADSKVKTKSKKKGD